MGKTYSGITPELASWIGKQRIFFVATAPLAAGGLINCSPKGLDSLRILGADEVAFMDLTGSCIETAALSRENGRIVFMFCAFDGSPKIVRLHGTSEVLPAGSSAFEELRPLFPTYAGARLIVRAHVTRVSESCGFAVPRYEFVSDRDTLVRWAESKGSEGLEQYRRQKNARSLDGLPGLVERID